MYVEDLSKLIWNKLQSNRTLLLELGKNSR